MFEIREKPEMVERAMLVSIYFDPSEAGEKQAMLDELEDLVSNLGIGIAGKHLIKSRDMHAKFLCGTGKAQEVKQLALDCRADCVVFDNMLSPSQQREWERLVDECVIDREEVILDIFARRARTREATLQVELARMQYSLPRMARTYSIWRRERGITSRFLGLTEIRSFHRSRRSFSRRSRKLRHRNSKSRVSS